MDNEHETHLKSVAHRSNKRIAKDALIRAAILAMALIVIRRIAVGSEETVEQAITRSLMSGVIFGVLMAGVMMLERRFAKKKLEAMHDQETK